MKNSVYDFCVLWITAESLFTRHKKCKWIFYHVWKNQIHILVSGKWLGFYFEKTWRFILAVLDTKIWMALKVSLKPKTEAVTQQARLESTDIRSILLKTDQSCYSMLRADLNKKFGSLTKTNTTWKSSPHRFKITIFWNLETLAFHRIV